MVTNPLQSLAAYSQFVAETLDRPTVELSTINVWPVSPYTGIAEGEVMLNHGFRLRMREELDFDDALITSYGYEVYRGQEKIYWYDDFPHPHDPSLASTQPHHKHVAPNIKRNRIPAPGLGFEHPNLLQILEEVEEVVSRYASKT